MTLCYAHRKSDPFVRFDKRIVFDSSISWKAKGLLTYAFSRDENWKFYKSEMMKHASDGETSFDSGIKELENAGYLHRRKINDPKTGKFTGWEWHFCEVPLSEEEFKKFHRNGGFPDIGESPISGKPGPNKKDNLSKQEQLRQQEAHIVADRTAPIPPVSDVVVVYSTNEKKPSAPSVSPAHSLCLDELDIPDSQKLGLTQQYDSGKLEKLVKRVLAWEGRLSDSKAVATILARWADWTDVRPTEALEMAAEAWCDKYLKAEYVSNSPTVPNFRCNRCNSYVEIITAPYTGTADCIPYSDPKFIQRVAKAVEKRGAKMVAEGMRKTKLD